MFDSYVKLRWFTGALFAEDWIRKDSVRYFNLIRDYGAEEVSEEEETEA